MELAFTGEFMAADRAMAMGLINQLTQPGEALATAEGIGPADRGERAHGSEDQQGHYQGITRLG